MKEVYIDRGIAQSRIAIFKDNNIEELYVENHDNTNITGNIYLGRIENVALSLEAAFVNIGIGKNGILHIDEVLNKNNFKSGKEVIVQAVREDSKYKGPKLSQNISIPGNYIVLLPNTDYIGVSKKIDSNIRQKLKDLAKKIYIENFGLILRTESYYAKDEDIIREYRFLIDLWDKNIKKAAYIKPPYLIFDVRDFYSFAVREYIKSDTDKIYVNREKDVDVIKDMLSSIGENKTAQVIYNEFDFSKVSAIEKTIKKITEKKKNLPSGGNIIIDKTEALTVIDVNTGSNKEISSKEEYVLNTNIEACKEIADSIRLENISGIIIIDFIDMKEEESKNKVIERLNNYLSEGRVYYKIYGFTNLGLLEMTRAKKGKSLTELIYNNNLKNTYSTAYILKLIENHCLRLSKHYNKYKFNVLLNKQLYDECIKNFPDFIYGMKNIYGIEIKLISSKEISEYEIIE